MKKLIFIAGSFICFCSVQAQNLHLTVFGGMSNYQGDLQSKRYTFSQANFAAGIGLLYEVTEKLYVRGNITFGKIEGSDKIDGRYPERNLSFSSPITDVHLGLEYDILNSYEKSVVPFVFTGISVYHYNPSAADTLGHKIFLQPLGTEGQGFFMGRQKYSLTGLAIPFGGGFKFSLSENIKLRLEVGFRKTFTDYLDDVSRTYADQTQLLANNGQLAVNMAFRGDETKPPTTYPASNSIRGNPGSKDWYYFTGIGLSFRLSPKFDGAGGRGGSQTGCPRNLY